MAERQRTPDEIRAEIERTRADMDETVQAIGNRLSPGQIVDQMWDRVRGGDAAASLVDAVKEHPVPAMLMGLGLGWLMYERSAETEGARLRRKHGDVGAGTYAPAEGRVGPYRGDAIASDGPESGLGDRVGGALSSAGEKLSGAAASAGDRIGGIAASVSDGFSRVRESAGERIGETRERAGARMEDLRGRAGERATELRDRAGELGTRAREGATRVYDEQPLALGAVAFGLGLASGLAVPSTRVENQALGRRSDLLKDEVRRTGSEAVQGAKRVAQEAAGAARAAVSRDGLAEELKTRARQVAREARDAAVDAIQRDGIADTLKERVRGIARETRDAAMQAAEREGLDAEGLRERARDAAERVRE